MIYTVAPDASGDFRSLREALEQAPSRPHGPLTLVLRTGEHRLGVISRSRVRLVGEDPKRTFLLPQEDALCLQGSDLQMENLVFHQDHTPPVRVQGNRITLRACTFSSLCFEAGNACLEDCEISSTPEFRGGRARFRNCRLPEENASSFSSPDVFSGSEPTFYLCGDSTMADYPPDQSPMTGWGQALQALTGLDVQNCAVCGRSSKSFISEGRLSLIELCLRPGDVLLIQFSHNDEKPDRERCTHEATFPLYLMMYVDAARRRGALPVLLTPLPRRCYEDGGLKRTHGIYPGIIRALARRENLLCLDMEERAEQYLASMTEEETRHLYCHVAPGHPNYPRGLSDNTHLHMEGAMAFARLVLPDLQAICERQVCEA